MANADARAVKELKGIGGWLVLPLLGLILAPLMNGVGMLKQLDVYTNLSEFNGSLQFWLVAEGALTVLIGIAGPVFLIVKMYQHAQSFPKLWIVWVLLLAAVNVAGTVAIYIFFHDEITAGKVELFDKETIRALAGSFFAIVIWIPYMLRSKRVKNTFQQPG